MISINIADLSSNLPHYLKQIQQGEEVAIIQHGKTIARIVPERQNDKRAAALQRLAALRGKMIMGDMLAPLNQEWTGDADNL
jgi:antitoxin (DNA-binding transcriptional repressor) of toxin-antitoxin stability system